MARQRSFDEAVVVRAAGAEFLQHGYEGTSIEDLVSATGLHRGSLYQAFASKRGLFVTCLEAATTQRPRDRATLDLVLVALLELAPRDPEVRRLVAVHLAGQRLGAHALGARLLQRARVPVPPEEESA